MRTTVILDDDLLAKAISFTGVHEKTSLLREALKALIEREGARRLALLGGSEPEVIAAPRRRAARRSWSTRLSGSTTCVTTCLYSANF